MIHDTQSAQISQKQDAHNTYVIMKTMGPPGYHHKGFVATHALGHMMYTYIYQPKLIRAFSKRFPELLKHDL